MNSTTKPLKILKLHAHNKLARLFHIGNDYYEIVITHGDDQGPVSRTKTIVGDCNRHAYAQFKCWTRCHYPTQAHFEERNRLREQGIIR